MYFLLGKTLNFDNVMQRNLRREYFDIASKDMLCSKFPCVNVLKMKSFFYAGGRDAAVLPLLRGLRAALVQL